MMIPRQRSESAGRLAARLCLVLALAPSPAVAQRANTSAGSAAAPLRARRSAGEFVGWGFALAPGPDLAVRRRDIHMPDFEVYDVVPRADSAAADAPVLLSIYAGNHPQFTGADLPPSRVAGLPARDQRVVDGTARVTRDVLIELPCGSSLACRDAPPLVLHAWYRTLPPAEAARADQLLARLRPTGGTQ